MKIKKYIFREKQENSQCKAMDNFGSLEHYNAKNINSR